MPSRVYNSKTKEGSRDRVCAITKYTCQARLVIQPPTQHLITYVTVVTESSINTICSPTLHWPVTTLPGEHHFNISVRALVIIAVEGFTDLLNVLLGNRN